MPILLSNVHYDTLRASFNAVTGSTSAPQPYLIRKDGHMKNIGTSQIRDVTYVVLPEGALSSAFILCVSNDIDIGLYDIITNITLLDDVTPWPSAAGANESWRVNFIHHTPPGILAHRECYIVRITAGGIPT